jgi:lipopolysaccharide export system permease protein
MNTLDRYIIRLMLIHYVILTAVMMLLFILVDLIIDLDEFLQAGDVRAQQWGWSNLRATLWVIGDYYGPRTLLIYSFFSGLLVGGAAAFTLVSLQRRRELVAVVAGGVSLYRVAAPVLIVGAALAALALPIQEYLIPRYALKIERPKNQVRFDVVNSFPVHLTPSGQGDLLAAAEFDPSPTSQSLRRMLVLQRDDAGVQTGRIVADSAWWDPDAQAWQLIGGYALRPGLDTADAALGGIRPDPEPAATYTTGLSPAVLLARRAATYLRLLSISQPQADGQPTLRQLADNPAVEPAQRRAITKIIWSRLSMLVIGVLTLVSTVPFFLRPLPGNVLGQSLQAAAVSIGIWGGSLVLLQLDAPWLHPAVAAWLPVALILPLAAALLNVART